MRARDMKYKECAERVRRIFGDSPEKVTLYTINESVSRSGMSAVIKVVAISSDSYQNEKYIETIAYGTVHGCGLDRGFEAAYNIFCYAYPNLRYQDFLSHRWL